MQKFDLKLQIWRLRNFNNEFQVLEECRMWFDRHIDSLMTVLVCINGGGGGVVL